MSKREVKFVSFGTDGACEHIIIDDRFKPKQQINYRVAEELLIEKGWFKEYKWKPIAIIPVGERRTPDEAKALAQVICDALNAQWVKEELGG